MLVGSQVRRVAIVGGMRIPFARGHGAYTRVGNQDMFTAVLQALVAKFRIAGERLGDVTGGAVLKHSKDFNLVRECVLSSGLDPATPGLDMQRACGTGLDATISIAMKIALGQMDAGIAGGFDTVSDPPIVYPRDYQQLLLRAFRGRSAWQKHQAVLRPAAATLQTRDARRARAPHRPVDGRTLRADGEDLEDLARGPGRARQSVAPERRQGLGARLLQRPGVERVPGTEDGQQRARRQHASRSWRTLKPAFDRRSGQGTLTAGNSTPLTDGASAVLLASEEWARARNLPVLA